MAHHKLNLQLMKLHVLNLFDHAELHSETEYYQILMDLVFQYIHVFGVP